MRPFFWISLILSVVGAVNWGLVGLFQFDLVAALFNGQTAPLSRVVYALVGVAGVVLAVTAAALFGDARTGAFRTASSAYPPQR